VEVELKIISVSTSHSDMQISSDNFFTKEADTEKPNQATLIQRPYNCSVDIKNQN